MRATIDTPEAETTGTPTSPADVLRTGFPGPAVAGVSLMAAPVLGAVGSALAIGIYAFKGADMMRGMAAHHARAVAGINVAVVGVALTVLAVLAVSSCVSARRPALGRTAGVITLVGLAGPLFFEGMYWGASFLTGPTWRQAGAHLIDGTTQIPNTIVNLSGPGLIVGFILLAVGSAKAGVLSRPRAVCLGMLALLPVGFVSGYIAVSAVGFAVSSVALVPLGLEALGLRPASDGRSPSVA